MRPDLMMKLRKMDNLKQMNSLTVNDKNELKSLRKGKIELILYLSRFITRAMGMA
jgi:hypothetical protein